MMLTLPRPRNIA